MALCYIYNLPSHPLVRQLFRFLGATIRSFAERSGACVQINVKEDSLDSHERVLVIAGETDRMSLEMI